MIRRVLSVTTPISATKINTGNKSAAVLSDDKSMTGQSSAANRSHCLGTQREQPPTDLPHRSGSWSVDTAGYHWRGQRHEEGGFGRTEARARRNGFQRERGDFLEVNVAQGS